LPLTLVDARPLRAADQAARISVDGSRHAVPIERLLERALGHLPGLIVDTIDEVAA
jgi:hypothetical protein